MKKTIVFIGVLLALNTYKLAAQQMMYIGGGATGTLPFVVNQNDFGAHVLELNYKYNFSYAFNGAMGFNFHDNMGLHFEGGYAKMGQVYEDKFSNAYYPGTHTKEIKLNYSHYLVAFRYNTYAYKNIQFEAMIGPQLGILHKSSLKYTVNGNQVPYPLQNAPGFSANYPVQNDASKFFNKMEVGGFLQAGVNILPIESIILNVGLRAYYSLTDLNKSEYRNHTEYGASHNFYAGIHVGVRWCFLTYEDFPLISRYR
jgi:hypothetical protein